MILVHLCDCHHAKSRRVLVASISHTVTLATLPLHVRYLLPCLVCPALASRPWGEGGGLECCKYVCMNVCLRGMGLSRVSPPVRVNSNPPLQFNSWAFLVPKSLLSMQPPQHLPSSLALSEWGRVKPGKTIRQNVWKRTREQVNRI